MIKIRILALLFLLSITISKAAHVQPERYYQAEWCNRFNGQMEYKLSDKTRVDCVTKNYAVEFDFANKWAEAVGQSLYYAIMTSKKPAIVLIIEKPSDWKYYYRIKKVADFFNFTLWYVKSQNYNFNKVN